SSPPPPPRPSSRVIRATNADGPPSVSRLPTSRIWHVDGGLVSFHVLPKMSGHGAIAESDSARPGYTLRSQRQPRDSSCLRRSAWNFGRRAILVVFSRPHSSWHMGARSKSGGDTVSGPPRRAGDGCASAIGHFICQGLIGAVPGRTTFQHNSRWCLARTKLHVKEETYATRWHAHSLYMSIARAANNPHVEISMH